MVLHHLCTKSFGNGLQGLNKVSNVFRTIPFYSKHSNDSYLFLLLLLLSKYAIALGWFMVPSTNIKSGFEVSFLPPWLHRCSNNTGTQSIMIIPSMFLHLIRKLQGYGYSDFFNPFCKMKREIHINTLG